MEQNLGRTCLILALLGLLLAVAFSVGPNVRPGGTVVAAHVATLQGGAAADDDVSEDDQKVERREPDEPQRPLKQGIAFLLAEYAQPPEAKNFTAFDESAGTKPQE